MKHKTPKKTYPELMEKFRKYRLFSLAVAESFDAWRIIPRAMLIAYSVLVLNMYVWYKSIPTYVQEHCDVATIELLVQNKVGMEDAEKAACSVQNVVGGPTPAQTALVTTIIGLSSLIFGFYTNSGRKWDNGMPNDLNPQQNQFSPLPPDPNYPQPIPPAQPIAPVAPIPPPDPNCQPQPIPIPLAATSPKLS